MDMIWLDTTVDAILMLSRETALDKDIMAELGPLKSSNRNLAPGQYVLRSTIDKPSPVRGIVSRIRCCGLIYITRATADRGRGSRRKQASRY